MFILKVIEFLPVYQLSEVLYIRNVILHLFKEMSYDSELVLFYWVVVLCLVAASSLWSTNLRKESFVWMICQNYHSAFIVSHRTLELTTFKEQSVH